MKPDTLLSMSQQILERQLEWSRSAGVEVDGDGIVGDVTENLLVSLSAETRRELGASASTPLGDSGKPSPLQRLDSTHVLLCHLMEPLRDAQAAAVDRALGGNGGAHSMRLCARLQNSSERTAPGAPASTDEAELMLDGPHPSFVLARYREPYDAPNLGRPDGFATDTDVSRSLAGCRGLALDLRANPSRYTHLEVARVLDAARLLTARYGPRRFRLALLWQDGRGREARRHARELDRLRMRIGGDVELTCLSWQTLFGRLRAAGVYDAAFAERIEARYFAD